MDQDVRSMGTLRAGADVSDGVPTPAVVLVDGRPWSQAWVRRVQMHGPLDEREAELVLTREADAWQGGEQRRLRSLNGQTVTIAHPLAVAGGETRLLPLLRGRIDTTRQRLSANEDELVLDVRCDWSDALDQQVNVAAPDPMGGRTWRLGDLLERLDASLSLGLDASLLEPTLHAAAVPAAIVRRAAARTLLRSLCERFGLVVRRSLNWAGGRVHEQREMRRRSHGRAIGLTDQQRMTDANIQRLRADRATPRPLHLIAEAAGAVVESTFDLLPGWADEPTDLSDTAYVRSKSADFDAVANAFRLWVLNEDGAFDGPRYDARALFEEPRPMPLRGLPFGEALTQDSAGRSVGVLVEQSVDGGQTWQRPAGRLIVLEDRAGIYLDDDELPATWLAAVRDGVAGLRVTATLRNPLPLEAERWRGNPFAGAAAQQRYALASAFGHRWVSPGSRYHAAVQDGERTADERDDRADLAAWLVERAGHGHATGGRVGVRTSGILPGLRIGDRLTQPLDVDAVAGPRLHVAQITHRWDRSFSEMSLEEVA